jgi:thioesterase domain-containing protein/malonyl CoA-acyl carrier protein transacylase/acyl carrier protein
MARGLYQHHSVFRGHFDACAKHMRQIDKLDLHTLVYPGSGDTQETRHLLMQTANSQPALFAIEYALARLWMEWGVQPQAMIGHSIGEYVAACLAGVFSLEDALTLVGMRGRLMQAQPEGSMLAVPLPEQELLPLLRGDLSLAAINSPIQCVVSGPIDAIAELEGQLAQRGIAGRLLHTSHAFHSRMMEPVGEPFRQYVKTLTLKAPHIPFISNVTGSWIHAAEAIDPAYWARQLSAPVRFWKGIDELLRQKQDVFLEVGPGHTLSRLLKRQLATKHDCVIVSSLSSPGRQETDEVCMLRTLGKLWVTGIDVNWAHIHTPLQPARIPLPTYAFERQRYWIEPAHAAESPQASLKGEKESENLVPTLYPRSQLVQDALTSPRNQHESTIAAMWQQLLGIESIGIYDNFFDLGGDSLTAVQLINQLYNHFQIKVLLHHIVEAPTIACLSQLLQKLAEETSENIEIPSTPLVLLKDGTRPPLFCIHPAGGTILCYIDLARCLDADQPLYGLQAPGLYGGPRHETLESAASSYLDAIRSVQPQGPYYLAGLSYGGNVAFEMARQLHQQGTEVALLALFDSHPPMAYHHSTPDRASFLTAFPWILSQMLGRERESITYKEIQHRDPQKQWEYVLGRIDAAGLVPPGVDRGQLYQLFGVWDMHHHALRSYDPPHKCYSQPMTLFRAAQEQPAELLALLNIRLDGSIPVAGWEILSSTPVHVYEVPGSHYTMLNKPHVQVLAEHLTALLTSHQETVN